MPLKTLTSKPFTALLKATFRIALVAGMVLAGHFLLNFELAQVNEHLVPGSAAFWVAMGLYICLMAVPFVPAAEIGLVLLALFGAQVAPVVYVATVAALSLAFWTGVGLAAQRGTGETAQAFRPASFGDVRRLPDWSDWRRILLRYRWWALIVLINTPGNTVVGGGGGLAITAGFSRTFSYPAFLVCTAIAVAPVPLAVCLADQFGATSALGGIVEGVLGGMVR